MTTFSATSCPRVFRSPRYLWVGAIAACVIAFVLGFVAFTNGLSWVYRVFYLAFSVAAVFGLADVAWTRIELNENGIEIISGFRRQFVPLQAIDSITWAKGVGVSIKISDGSWIGLPEVGTGSQALSNSLRAWLKGSANR